MDGLIIKKFWLNKILAGDKTWEIRGSRTHKRGEIYLIQSGSGTIVGKGSLVDCKGPLSVEELKETYPLHQIEDLSIVKYQKVYAWVLKDAERIEEVPYVHPQGAVIWVKNLEVSYG